MFPQDVLDNLSDTLMRDERILSSQERALLADLLQRTRSLVDDPQDAPSELVFRAAGELIADRAYRLLGSNIARKLAKLPSFSFPGRTTAPWSAKSTPRPPAPAPSPGEPTPKSPFPPAPGPPGPHVSDATQRSGNFSVKPAEFLPATCAVLEEFLAPQELNAMLQYTLENENKFQVSEVISPGVKGGVIDYEQRRSRVLMELGVHEKTILDRIQASWPQILQKLNHDNFSISRMEAQITASNQGDYFRWHTDNGQPEIESRELTFVYFFHREPKAFSGGQLRLYDSRWENGGYVPTDRYRTIEPQQNQVVAFPSSLAHEITPVECSSGAFADSRFTVNGWLHR